MRERGFSLMEILVTFLLVSSISLALLKQQWQTNRLRVQIHRQQVEWLQAVNQREQGLTLLECLLGIVLSLLLLTLVMQQYLHIKQETIGVIQAVTRASRLHLAFDLLRRRGHQAGFCPCLPIRNLMSFDHRTHQPLQTLEIKRKPGFKLTFYRMSDEFVSIKGMPQAHTFALLGSWRPHPQHPVIIADCRHAEVIQSYHIHSGEMRVSSALKYTYHSPIYLGEWITEAFWISTTSHERSTLFYTHAQHTEALLSDVYALDGQLEAHHPHPLLHLSMDGGMRDPIELVIRMYHL